jgi:polyisoprenoid-binding protein YceI
MSRFCRCIAAALSVLFAGATIHADVRAAGQQWQVDRARSSVNFTVTKLGFADVDGRFTDFTADVHHDPSHPERSTIAWNVRIASVLTDAANRDRSLLGADYFDAAAYPTMSFRSQRVRPLDGGRLEIAGAITIRGHTEPLTVVATPVEGGFETRFEIDRLRFNVRGGTVMSRLIGRMVRVHLVLRGSP